MYLRCVFVIHEKNDNIELLHFLQISMKGHLVNSINVLENLKLIKYLNTTKNKSTKVPIFLSLYDYNI